MFGLDKYRNIFGKPNKGIHRFRIFNIPIADVLLTFLLAKFIQIVFFNKGNYLIILISTFILGIFMHILFGVKTPITKFLFGNRIITNKSLV